jgi:hypothetical protein
MINGISVHPFAPIKLICLVVQAPISQYLQIQVFTESCQCNSRNFLARGEGRGAQKGPVSRLLSSEFRGLGALLQHRVR